MVVINLLLMTLNLLSIISVLRYHEYKKAQIRDQFEKAGKAIHPALFRSSLMAQECCVICHGNTPNKPAGYPRNIKAHELCLNRLKAGEIDYKKVGQPTHEKQINLQEMLLSSQLGHSKLLTVKEGA